MRDRIRPPKDLEEILDKLKEDKVFETKQKGMMFAAAVGYCLHRDKVDTTEIDRLAKPSGWNTSRARRRRVHRRARRHHPEDLGVVANERQQERIELFQRYALFGLKELKRACYDEKPEYPLYGVLKLIDQLDRPEKGDLPGLEGLL